MSLKAKKKLTWLGLARAAQSLSEVKGEIELLKENVGSWENFEDGVDDQTQYSEFNTYLQNNGFTSTEADTFIQKIKNNFTDDDNSGTTWDEFHDFVVDTADSYEEFQNQFGNQNTLTSDLEVKDGANKGNSAAGIKVFDSAGVTRDGVDVPAGAVEVFGTEVHFSKTDNTTDGSVDPGTISYSNLRTDDSDDVVDVGQSITISADVENTHDSEQQISTALTEDGFVIRAESFRVQANSNRTISFTVTKDEYVCHDYQIAGLSPITVCWEPSELI